MRQTLAYRSAKSWMGSQLQKRIKPRVDGRIDPGLEQHRLAQVAPPIVGCEIASLHDFAGNRRDHRDDRLPGSDLCQASAQLILEWIHLPAMKCVVDVQDLAEYGAPRLLQIGG